MALIKSSEANRPISNAVAKTIRLVSKEISANWKLIWPMSFCLNMVKPVIDIAEISNMYNRRFIFNTNAVVSLNRSIDYRNYD